MAQAVASFCKGAKVVTLSYLAVDVVAQLLIRIGSHAG